MDLFEAVGKRHSYRGPFLDQPVPRDDLRKMVEAGLQAPSGKNLQTTTFVIVEDPELVRRINGMPNGNAAVRNARAFIACVIGRQPEAAGDGPSFLVEDCAAAVENILLAATALGYGCVWVDGWLRTDGRAAQIGQLLGVPPNRTVRIIIPIGRPSGTVERRPKKPFEERAWFNRHSG